MRSIDDFPTQNPAQPIQDDAEAAFEASLQRVGLFGCQHKDRRDYGSDYQLEVIDGNARTNFRVHVQLKGSTESANADGSISVSVARTNLNYLLSPSSSIYVCHRHSDGKLLVRAAEDVYAHYARAGDAWKEQQSLTVRFVEAFDDDYQRKWHAVALARGRAARDDRLEWIATPPERLGAAVVEAAPRVNVPASASEARALLNQLYEVGEDAGISRSFDEFRAVLGSVPLCLTMLYMAEVNLGLNDQPHSAERLREALGHFTSPDRSREITPSSIAYTVGNAHLALNEYAEAVKSFRAGIAALARNEEAMGAQCWKNLGSALELAGDWEQARIAFESALKCDPDLAEAHMALAQWHRRQSRDLERAIKHIDLVAKAPGSAVSMRVVHAWRAAVLFELNRTDAAFAAVDAVVGGDKLDDWEWFWCARLVRTHGKKDVSTALHALKFWRSYLKFHRDDPRALSEAFTCEGLLHERGGDPHIDFSQFKAHAEKLLTFPDVDAGLIWDRVGHWAQRDDDWTAAERAFRHAFEAEPNRYAYCLGVALNHLDRWEDALAVLLPATETSDADSVVWFQTAFAQDRVGNTPAAVDAYRRAIELEPGYALAHFNLGGVLWNARRPKEAFSVWSEAVARFPEHELAAKLRRDFSEIFGA
jgi:tetratricopeptide (TPR) repeat protein